MHQHDQTLDDILDPIAKDGKMAMTRHVLTYLRGLFNYAIEDDPARTRDVFSRLRPRTPSCLPDWLNGVLVVMDGTPSQVWFHDRVDQFETGSMVTTVGSDPRRMRGVGSVIGVTNFGSNTVSILTWDGASTVANHGQVGVGTGPIGLDAMPLGNGNVGFVCTSATDNTYNYIEVTTSGSVVSNISAALPEFCTGAKHAVFLPGPIVYIVLACQGGEISFIETILEY